MQVTVEATGSLERRMTVQVPEERIASEVESRLRRLGKTARIHGFRPGKAPPQVVERSYGRQVRDEVVGEVLRSSFADAVAQNSLAPAGGPTIRELTAAPGQGLSYTAVFEVYPKLSLPDLKELKVSRPVAEVMEQDVDQMILTLRRQRQTWQVVDRGARTGDRVVLDYEGSVGGEPLEGNTGKQVPVELGTHRLVGELEERLVGIRAGEEREVTVDFPADHRNASAAGKAVTFKITAHRVEEPHLPEMDEGFFASFGVARGVRPACAARCGKTWSASCARTSRAGSRLRSWTACWPPFRWMSPGRWWTPRPRPFGARPRKGWFRAAAGRRPWNCR